jgi:hypothetical protein
MPLDTLLANIITDFPHYTFVPHDSCMWRQKDAAIYYAPLNHQSDLWDLLHEIGHAELAHHSYNFDVELVRLEAEAWQKAQELSSRYNQCIPEDHAQGAIDTYRQWLEERSNCPRCHSNGLQHQKNTYSCINCRCSWRVPLSRMCITRRYQRLVD